jgi:hypothetical protein
MKRLAVLVTLLVLVGCGSAVKSEKSPCFKSGKFRPVGPGLIVSSMGTDCDFRPLPEAL